ncbi:MAG: hypothetical protein KU37_03385 [Sulfuricurvum sp. PC08-66]|nr:MAG: hypothetical protein KU37_03385 [Sulfuricurvum sp. PC08-66]
MRHSVTALVALGALFVGCTSAPSFPSVTAVAQTQAVAIEGDVADDSAIWVDATDSARSLIIGTHKKGGGVEVYDLNGTRLQSLPDGKFNNVDVRYDFEMNGSTLALVAASNRDDDTLALYGVDAHTHTLRTLSLHTLPNVSKSYGLCMYQDANATYVITNSKTGHIVMDRIDANGTQLMAVRVGEAQVATQTEGCVADDARGILYVGEEDVGIWRFDIAQGLHNNGVLFDTVSKNSALMADIEGLALWKHYLIASSQGNNSYAVYDTLKGTYVGSFRVVDGTIDGTSETDGIEASSMSMGAYTQGIMVIQDGHTPSGKQNFKIVDFSSVIDALKLPR